MKKLTKENWLPGNEGKECFWLWKDGRMVCDYELNTMEVDYHGYTTLKEAKKMADIILEHDPDAEFDIVATALCGADDEVLDEYLSEYGNDMIVIESFNHMTNAASMRL